MTFRHEIELGNNQIIEVIFTGTPREENTGIGSYEYGSEKAFDKGIDYVSMEHYGDPVWDKSLYTTAQNKKIEEELEKVSNLMCEQY